MNGEKHTVLIQLTWTIQWTINGSTTRFPHTLVCRTTFAGVQCEANREKDRKRRARPFGSRGTGSECRKRADEGNVRSKNGTLRPSSTSSVGRKVHDEVDQINDSFFLEDQNMRSDFKRLSAMQTTLENDLYGYEYIPTQECMDTLDCTITGLLQVCEAL